MKIAERKFGVLAVLLVASFLTLWGCPKKTEVSSSPEGQASTPAVQATNEAGQQSTAGKESMETATPHETAAPSAEGLKPVYFDFDKSFIRDDAKAIMKANAAWLKAHPKVKIRIEGNCDERGTKEYNQALGQRRAASAKKYLTDLGISGKRISLISYGKEKPICSESTEDCWQKNRRDDFDVRE
jgi:peptidoglycan-associated lipoprotein